jgi:multiple sugar transport system permease protein
MSTDRTGRAAVPHQLDRQNPRWSVVSKIGTAVTAGAAICVVFPFIWMFLTSFRTQQSIFSDPGAIIPGAPNWDAYISVWSELPFGRMLINSIVFAGGATLLCLIFDSMTAFALARLDFPGKTLAFYLVIATLMVPYQVTLIPLFQTILSLDWLDTYQGLIVPRATSAFGIFLLRQFFIGLPRDLDDAARIDGAGAFRIYWSVLLPLAKPALATLGVFHFMNNWNDFLWPLVITTNEEMRTLPAGLTMFAGQFVVEHAVLMAGATISLLPLALAFFFAQRYFVQGIATTGFK